jgi:hypothetical protein
VAPKALAAEAEIASCLPPVAANLSMSEHVNLRSSFDISEIRYM